jgi:hypothetical protein
LVVYMRWTAWMMHGWSFNVHLKKPGFRFFWPKKGERCAWMPRQYLRSWMSVGNPIRWLSLCHLPLLLCLQFEYTQCKYPATDKDSIWSKQTTTKAGITAHSWQKPKISFVVIRGYSWQFMVTKSLPDYVKICWTYLLDHSIVFN